MCLTRTPTRQFALSTLAVVAAAAACYPFAEVIGYRAVALILMFVVSVLAMRLSLYPVLLAAVLSAAIWDFFFIPPFFTFHVNDPADALMLAMYFIIALLNGVLTARIRRFEKTALDEEARANTLKLYDTLFQSLTHELRTPIATILGASDNLLDKDSNLDKSAQKALYGEINTAANHTPEGGTIDIEAAYREGAFYLAVADSGSGFPAAELDRVFEKYHRFSPHKTNGIGLGLSIAKGFVGAHGGAIKAENIPGGGARISIRIPSEAGFLEHSAHE